MCAACRYSPYAAAQHEDALLIGLLPMMWRGLDAPSCCVPDPVRKPSADCCLGGGRLATEQYLPIDFEKTVVWRLYSSTSLQLNLFALRVIHVVLGLIRVRVCVVEILSLLGQIHEL